MTDTIAHPPLPEAAAHMLSRDLDDGRYDPLYTAQQMREYRDAPRIVDDAAMRAQFAAWVSACGWGLIGSQFADTDLSMVSVHLWAAWKAATRAAAPIEQATGERVRK